MSKDDTLASFGTAITGLSGAEMPGADTQIRIVGADLGLGDSLAIDNIAGSAVPVPPAALAGLGLLCDMSVVRRLHK